MYNSPFTTSSGNATVLVTDAAPVQAPRGPSGVDSTSYRIRNLTNASAYITWRPGNATSTVPTGMTAVAPSAGNPSINTIGMIATSIEVFGLPPNCWFLASSGATFEVTPGEGI